MVIGGRNGSTYLSRIAAYDPSTDKWTNEGQLRSPRIVAGVLPVTDSSFIIMGGFEDSDDNISDQIISEKCEYNNEQLECSYQEPTLPEGKTLNKF